VTVPREHEVRYRLSTLLAFVTVLAIAMGLGYQVYVLQRQVNELSTKVEGLLNGAVTFNVQQQGAGPNAPTYRVRVESIQIPAPTNPYNGKSRIGVPWSVERAMLLEGRERSQQLSPDQGPSSWFITPQESPTFVVPPDSIERPNDSDR
jgi:hypothetical protein